MPLPLPPHEEEYWTHRRFSPRRARRVPILRARQWYPLEESPEGPEASEVCPEASEACPEVSEASEV